MKKVLFFFLLFLCLGGLNGQDFTLLSQQTANGVALRWYPETFDNWTEHLAAGYLMERATGDGPFERLNARPIPVNLAEESRAGKMVERLLEFGDSINIVRTDSAGPVMLRAIYHSFLRRVTVQPQGIQQSGLYYVDATAKPARAYRYRLLSAQGERLAETRYPELRKITAPELTITDREYVAVLTWKNPKSQFDQQAYRVERAVTGADFKPINKRWYFPKAIVGNRSTTLDSIVVRDTVPALGQTYTYRLVGITPFGETKVGEAVRFQARDQTPPERPTNFTVTAAEEAAQTTITWQGNDADGDLEGYHLYRSRFPDSAYVRLTDKLLPKQQGSYVDEDIVREGTYYYRIEA
ncbi:MAG: hypothetical protein AAF597_17590, partial [Bacteroidota bacterium]